MNFIDRLKSWFGVAAAPAPQARQFIKDPTSGVMVETDDPDHAAIVGLAFKTGKPVLGSRGEDGKLTIQTLDPK